MFWFWTALTAAVLWGISYAMSGFTLKHGISGTAQLALSGLVLTPFYCYLAYANGSLQASVRILRNDIKIFGYFAVVVICYAFANILTYISIKEKNATLASMIEIAYPFFTALFVWLFFGENELTLRSLLGGLMILSGIGLIYFSK